MEKDNIDDHIAILSILYKSDDVLDEFFYSISLQKDVNYTLFLLNNDKNDVTKELVSTLSIKHNIESNVVYTDTENNMGFAKANNILIKNCLEAGYKYFLFANNDTLFNYKHLLLDLKTKSEQNDIVTPKIIYYKTSKIWYLGGHLDKNKGLNIHENENALDSTLDQNERYVEFAPACFLMVNKHVFEKIGLFNEKYFVYWEDVDFCIRALNSGLKIILTPSLVVEHKVSVSTGGRTSLFSTYYFLRNRLYIINEHYKGWSKIKSLIYTYLTSFIKLIIYDKKRKKVIWQAIIDSKKV